MELCVLFTGFNQYKSELGYRDLVFGMKFFMNIMNEIRYITIDNAKLAKSYPKHAMLLAYLLQTGTRDGEAFYLPSSSLDFVMEILRNMGHVYYLEPEDKVSFSDEIRAPSLKADTRPLYSASSQVC